MLRQAAKEVREMAARYQELFKRVEKKYLLVPQQYQAFRQCLEGVAETDMYGETTICNIYFDTPDYHLIRTSLNQPVYKEKLRLRTYGIPTDTSPAFIEIKKKYRGVVYKRRISLPYREAHRYLTEGILPERTWTPEEQLTLREIMYLRKRYGNPVPKMVICYDRIAMQGLEDPELRLTFDTRIRWRTDRLDLRLGADGRELIPGKILLEAKLAGAMPLGVARDMSRLRIFGTSFSKYGSAYQVWAARSMAGTRPAAETAGMVVPLRQRVQAAGA